MKVLCEQFPDYRKRDIHESSPYGAVFERLRREVPRYMPTNFWPDVQPGSYRDGIRCENLESMTFSDGSFDMVITQDVLEHVLTPQRALAEIGRILRPGGAHIFTVPWYAPRPTYVRAAASATGIEYFAEKDYHGNPIDDTGALVVTEWGADLPELIFRYSGMITAVFLTHDPHLGLEGKSLEVFVSRKPA
jgi:SAM-dependent methyltransferase